MATLRNKRRLAAVTRETLEEHPRNGQSQNTYVPRINEEYITQVSEEIEGRVTKKLSQEFSRTESRILGALSKLDEFLSNQQIQTHSRTVPGTFRNTNVENQGTNEDDSKSDPHPEAGIFRGQTTQNSGPKDCRDSNPVAYERFEKTSNFLADELLYPDWNLMDHDLWSILDSSIIHVWSRSTLSSSILFPWFIRDWNRNHDKAMPTIFNLYTIMTQYPRIKGDILWFKKSMFSPE